MSSLSWIRCNKCYISFKSIKPGNASFSLTQCGHVFCHKCIRKVLDGNQCIECSTTGVQSLELTDPLPGAVKNIFEPFLDICDRMIFAAKFQHSQMMIFYRRLEELEKKYYAMKVAYWEKSKQYEKMKMDYQELHNRRDFSVQKAPSPVTPRTYFVPNMFVQGEDVSRANPRHYQRMERVPQRDHRLGYQMNGGYLTDSSDTSTSTIRPGCNVPMTPDGIFRIPNLRRVPRSTGNSSTASSMSRSTTGATKNMF